MVRYRNCAVTGCEDEHSHRHRFPNPIRYEKLFKAWVHACRNPKLTDLDPEQVYKSYRVCHQHFTPEDISSNMYLKKGIVIPTQNLPDNPHDSISPEKMSHKSGRRSRRVTNDDESSSFKAPPIVKPQEEPLPPQEEEIAPNNKTPEKSGEQNGSGGEKRTRSRSSTPKKLRKIEDNKPLNGSNGETEKLPEIQEEVVVETSSLTEEVTNGHSNTVEPEQVEMDALILLADDPDPELLFDDNSDLESGQESPAVSRCRTRRSQTRNIPTPKTPRVDETETLSPIAPSSEEEKTSEDVTYESISDAIDASTKAEPGGDSTRFEYIAVNSTTNEGSNSFLETSKNQSFGDTLRKLSTRRTIRPISDEYRMRVLKSPFAFNKSRASVEQVNEGGVKRKLSGENGDNDHKRFKGDSPGFFSRFISPLASITSSFRGDNVLSSTPKLTAYKDDDLYLVENQGKEVKLLEAEAERGWCSIM